MPSAPPPKPAAPWATFRCLLTPQDLLGPATAYRSVTSLSRQLIPARRDRTDRGGCVPANPSQGFSGSREWRLRTPRSGLSPRWAEVSLDGEMGAPTKFLLQIPPSLKVAKDRVCARTQEPGGHPTPGPWTNTPASPSHMASPHVWERMCPLHTPLPRPHFLWEVHILLLLVPVKLQKDVTECRPTVRTS